MYLILVPIFEMCILFLTLSNFDNEIFPPKKINQSKCKYSGSETPIQLEKKRSLGFEFNNQRYIHTGEHTYT